MSSVVEIEQAITRLTREQFVELERWFAEQRSLLWDRQIEEDATAGRLDALWAEAEKEIAEGKTRPLDELLDH